MSRGADGDKKKDGKNPESIGPGQVPEKPPPENPSITDKSGKKDRRYAIIGLGVLIGIISLFILLIIVARNNVETAGSGSLTVVDLGGNITNHTIEDLKKMPSVQKTVFLKGSESSTNYYKGVEVLYLINQTQNHDNYTCVRAVASDRYSVNIDRAKLSEVGVFVAYEMDNQTMSPSREGGYGPLRLIVPQKDGGDFNGQFSVKYLVRIELRE